MRTPSYAGKGALRVLFLSAFLIVVHLPLVGMVLNLDSVEIEARVAPANWEVSAIGDLLGIPGVAKQYFNDHFGFRGSLLQTYGILMVECLGRSSSPRVILGRDDWLFLRDEGAVEGHLRVSPFSTEDMAAWGDLLQRRATYCRKLGARYVFVVAPDKHSIYSEALPTYLEPKAGVDRLSQLCEYLGREYPDVCILDLRQTLSMEARRARLYHKTDTHWNAIGAAVAAGAMADRLRSLGLGSLQVKIDLAEVRTRIGPGGDLARMLGLGSRLSERRLDPLITVGGREVDSLLRTEVGRDWTAAGGSQDALIERAVVFHDSFGVALRPVLSTQFREVEFVWSNRFDAELVENARPEVVIQELAERRLMTVDAGSLEGWPVDRSECDR